MQKKLNETMDNAYPINPKKAPGLSVIYSMPTGRPVFFLFKDVEKKMELKSPETPHPREPQHMPRPPTQKCGNLDTSSPNLTQPCG